MELAPFNQAVFVSSSTDNKPQVCGKLCALMQKCDFATRHYLNSKIKIAHPIRVRDFYCFRKYDLYNMMPMISAITMLTKANEKDIMPVNINFSKNNANTIIKKIATMQPPTIPNEYLSILLRR